jgi:serine/threonine protein kinase
MESSSDFIIPTDFSSEWHNIALVKSHSRTQVYTATRYGRRFVLKALAPETASLTDYRLQQEQEFQLGIQLVHPNIATTYSLEEVEGVGRCIVQEWIDGVTLGEWLQTKPSKASRERVLNQVLDALEYIHGLQLVHHDLKTDNILITRNGANAKLIDFGLSAADASVSPVPNNSRQDIESLQKLFPDLCPKGSFATIAALRKTLNRRKRFIRLLPVILSALLLTAAITLFYLSWYERHLEQQRFETMIAQVDSCIAKERAYLLEMINSCDSCDAENEEEKNNYFQCWTRYNEFVRSQWAVRDSLMNQYEENDPLREQCWQYWVRQEAQMSTELTSLLSSKLKY